MRRALALGCLVLLACAAAAPAREVEPLIVQRDRAFSAREAVVPRGTVLRFSNEDEFPHQINASGPGVEMNSDLQSPGDVLRLPLPQAGTVEVRCGIHPRMRLTVQVR
ncbi:hypothetical protein E0493_20885 [Roseomonas sp. M0104]|uniref:EfeO-type cupredoxin-like domain-containing protein n=1 Tax=Teichococcus coralli TaxID=2545983 RepID=A0A845BQZ1_9PROT|nr:hypothetical protein [Pseudoroseomonas coralli]MXP65809.1 hypothetical protein [Pseudoroseomonas coralli]